MVRLRKIGPVATVLALLTMALPLTAPPAAATADDPTQLHVGDNGDGYGFNVWGLDFAAAVRANVNAEVRGAGFGWVHQQVIWASMEPTKGNCGTDFTAQLDLFVGDASAQGLRVLLSVVRSPAWVGANGGLPAARTQDFTDFMTFLTERYRGRVQAYEIWNEPNAAVETGGHVAAADYLPVLRAGFRAVKQADPAAVVVLAGLTPTGVNDPAVAISDVEYLRQLYALNNGEITQYYDVLGAHAGSTCNPPDSSWPDAPATTPCGTDPDGGRSYTKDDSLHFKRILELRAVMVGAGGGGTKMWLTEFGWDSAQTTTPGYAYARYVSEQQQAQYLIRAFELGRSYPWMGAMFVWNLNFFPHHDVKRREVRLGRPTRRRLRPSRRHRAARDAKGRRPSPAVAGRHTVAAGRGHAATATVTEGLHPATANRRHAHAAIPRGGRVGIIPGGHPDPAATRGGDTASTVTRMRPRD
jgi:hypothetical protein